MTSRRPRVLVVDDEEPVRTYAERVLQQGGYDPVLAPDGSAALRLADQTPGFDLFIVDLVMPKMDGHELARQIRRADPDAKVLYFTGYADRLFREKPTLWRNEAFVEKPATVDGLLEAASLLLFGHTHGPASGDRPQ